MNLAPADPAIPEAIFLLAYTLEEKREAFLSWVADCIDEHDWSMQLSEMRAEFNALNKLEN